MEMSIKVIVHSHFKRLFCLCTIFFFFFFFRFLGEPPSGVGGVTTLSLLPLIPLVLIVGVPDWLSLC